MTMFGWLSIDAPGPASPFAIWLFGSGLAVLIGLGLALWRGGTGSSGQVHRWARRSRRNDGVASAWSVLRVSSVFAVRRRAAVLRPSHRSIPWFLRWRVRTTEFATALAVVGFLRVWSSCEDVTCVSAARAPARPARWRAGSSRHRAR
jgi:hypothetical protein